MNDVQQQFKTRIGRFGRVRRAVANGRQAYASGIAALGVGIAALVLLSGWTANPFVNCALTSIGIGLLVWQIIRLARRWEWRRQTLSEAFRLEDLAGDLNSRVVSAVDFVNRPAPVAPLVAAVIERARQDLERPFEHLIDRSVRNRLRIRCVLLLVFFLLLGSTDRFGFARMSRTVRLSALQLRESLFPTRYELIPGAGSHVYRAGRSVETGIRFTRFSYPEVTMLRVTVGQEGEERIVLPVDPSRKAVVTMKSDSGRDREYRIRFVFGKRITEETHLVFATAPVIENMQTDLVYPLYTRLVSKTIEGVQDRITALPGTRVSLGFTFSKPVNSAVLTFDDGGTKEIVPLDVMGRFASLSLMHTIERRATLQVEDIHGFPLDAALAIEFNLAEDNPPKLIIPAFLKQDMPWPVGALGSFGFGVRADDDFGVVRCVLRWRKATTEDKNSIKDQGEFERPFLPPKRVAIAAFDNVFKEQDAKPGDMFFFQVEAFDNRDPKPQSKISAWFSIYLHAQELDPGGELTESEVFGGSLRPRPRAQKVYGKNEKVDIGVKAMSAIAKPEQQRPDAWKRKETTETRSETRGFGTTANDYTRATSGGGSK
jgi:hypothetical protein